MYLQIRFFSPYLNEHCIEQLLKLRPKEFNPILPKICNGFKDFLKENGYFFYIPITFDLKIDTRILYELL
jgi:hypothetical protein